MGMDCTIKLVAKSKKENVTITDVKELIEQYCHNTKKTGEQLGWDYEESAFPYTIHEVTKETVQALVLKGKMERYRWVAIGIDDNEPTEIQISLSEISTAGDKGKANEFAKLFAKKLEAELHLFNDRVLYYNKR